MHWPKRSQIYFYLFFAAAWMLKFVFAYLANMAVLCYPWTIICCCQVQDYIYWIKSTENDHRHHHKFIKYEKRLRKEGNMLGLPINNNQAKSLPLQREIWRVALPWVRSIQRQLSNWSHTYILHLFHLEDTSLLFFFISESVKVRFLPHVDLSLPTCCLLFINSAQAQDGFT